MLFQTANEQQTERLAAALARCLHPCDVVFLYGRPGAGKTAFVRGVAQALGIKGHISSPTFALVHEHPLAKGMLVHMDLYRLEGQGLEELGLEEYLEAPDTICLVEWPQGLEDWVQAPICVELTPQQADEQARTIRIDGVKDELRLQEELGCEF